MSDGRSLRFLDLFAGCGGLSLGLWWAGLEPAAAIEMSPMAAETYYHNIIRRLDLAGDSFAAHLRKPACEQLLGGLLVDRVETLVADPGLLEAVGSVDIVCGGPPCQGFSLAGRREPGDPRNKMPEYFLDVVETLRPRAVILENVEGIASRGRTDPGALTPIWLIANRLRGFGYEVQMALVTADEFGVPQRRRRVLLVAVAQSAPPAPVFWQPGEEPPRFFAGMSVQQRPTVADALLDLNPARRLPAGSPFGLEMKTRCVPAGTGALSQVVANHDLRKHTPAVRRRFALHLLLRDLGVTDKVFWYAAKAEARRNRVLCEIARAQVAFPVAGYGLSFQKAGELADTILALRSGKHSQSPLKPDQPAPTVMTLPDDFVHPTEPRTLTVREMARLQSFPDAFEFRGKATTGGQNRRHEVPQYTQVGNAVPPLMAERLGRQVAALLSETQEAYVDPTVPVAARSAG